MHIEAGQQIVDLICDAVRVGLIAERVPPIHIALGEGDDLLGTFKERACAGQLGQVK